MAREGEGIIVGEGIANDSRSHSRSKSKGFVPVAPRGFAGGTLERAGGITNACYDTPLPNPNNQLNQWE